MRVKHIGSSKGTEGYILEKTQSVDEVFIYDGMLHQLRGCDRPVVRERDVIDTIKYHESRGMSAFENACIVRGRVMFIDGSTQKSETGRRKPKVKYITQPCLVNSKGDVAYIGTRIELDVYQRNGWGSSGVLTGFNRDYVELDGGLNIGTDNIRDFTLLR